MSLTVEGERRRDRSRSRSRDGRPREESERFTSNADMREQSYAYPEDGFDDRYRKSDTAHSRMPYPSASELDNMLPSTEASYRHENRRAIPRARSPRPEPHVENHVPGSFPNESIRRRQGDVDESRGKRRDKGETRYDSDERHNEPEKRYSRRTDQVRPSREQYGIDNSNDERMMYLPQKYSRRYDHDRHKDTKAGRPAFPESDEEDLGYGMLPPPSPQQHSPPTYGSYIPSLRSEDKHQAKHTYYDDDKSRRRQSSPAVDERYARKAMRDHPQSNKWEDSKDSKPDVLTIEPSYRKRDRSRDARRDASPGPSGLAVQSNRRDRDRSRDARKDASPGPGGLAVQSDRRDRDRSRDRRTSKRDSSPLPPTQRMTNLTVDTQRPANMSLAAAPGSPLLESYHGTYQSCSPMPSPLLLASQSSAEDPRVLEVLSPLNSDVEGDGKKRSRRARFHDPEDIASRLARALKGDKPPDTEPLVDILPSLSHEQVMELRQEYKRLVKTGSERKGVNIAKHIRARLKDEDPLLMKACYSVALGMWESEAYWANFWYQGDKTRRELLIETLMGRTNEEIRHIKDSFTDKKHDNSLTKCMKTELKEDKFKKAVLSVLEERRMEDLDLQGRRIPLDYDLVDKDAVDLRRAVKADKGGESLMISIVLQRSDSHLRAVLGEYERQYRGNFAREALKKSGNLVGELLAHVLNGVINRPVRDALLLHHAVSATRKDSLRRELLVSRLVRYHWDPIHMQAIKRAYKERYGRDLEDAVRDATSGQWGAFCLELCIDRTPNHVRRIERVENRG